METAIFLARSLRASGIISLISASLESLIQTSECGNSDRYTEVLTFMLLLHLSTITTVGLLCHWETNQNLRDQTPDLFCLRISTGVSNAKTDKPKKISSRSPYVTQTRKKMHDSQKKWYPYSALNNIIIWYLENAVSDIWSYTYNKCDKMSEYYFTCGTKFALH